MPIELYIAPPAAGKTSWCVDLVRREAAGLAGAPRVVVGGSLQVDDWQRRLAVPAPGTLGVRVSTFHRLYADSLAHCGRPYALIGDTVQFRLLRILLDRVPLERLGVLADRPGLVSALQELVAELGAGLVGADALREMVRAIDGPPRLRDLAAIYAAYQEYLSLHGWTDEPGLGHVALEALTGPPPWPLVVADGRDTLAPLEAAFLRRLAECGARVVVTLTEPPVGAVGLLGQAPAERLADLVERLGVPPQALPFEAGAGHAAPSASLRCLRTALFAEDVTRSTDQDGALTLVEAPDRVGEVRAALRWLKARLREQPDRPGELGVLVRRLEPYRAAIAEVAAEYGLPVRIAGGLPLADNPAVAALMNLLRLVAQRPDAPDGPALPRRGVVEAWRSPYFTWECATSADDPTPVGIRHGDARTLDAAARAGRAIRGLSQWQEALDLWVGREGEVTPGAGMADADGDLVEGGGYAATGCPPQELHARFERFVARMTPPQASTMREYVRWVEEIIGPDPLPPYDDRPPAPDTYSLRMVQSIRAACGDAGSHHGDADPSERALAQADLAALQRLKEVLRGLVWTEEALGASRAIDYGRFLQELSGTVDAARYEAPVRGDCGEIIVAEVQAAAGMAFRALAVLGLAEGEFPAPHREDPFLTDRERSAMHECAPASRLPLRLESREVEAFCRLVSSAWEQLLLTRPRLAETGAVWAASPYWEEVLRQIDVRPRSLTSDAIPNPDEVCSWPELLANLAARADGGAGTRALEAWLPPLGSTGAGARALLDAERRARQVLAARRGRALGPFDGDLGGAAGALASRYPPEKPWSASRLEAYRTCPLSFFVGSVLGLEPRPEPAEGLDARQLGNLYHRIMEEVYRACIDSGGDDSCDALLAALPEVARRVLDAAPQEEGFRETPWWWHTRTEIEENVRSSIVALADMADGYRPLAFEARFFAPHELCLEADGMCLRIHGLIDRVDISDDGKLRIIDYKTAGPTAFSRAAMERGDKLQLPLYALAARDALGLGEPADGFYWHVRDAKPSPARLARCEGGAEGAMARAARVAAEVVAEVLAGHFAPRPPAEGCPPYCAAASFCWHLRARRG